MNIVLKKIEELKPALYNPREISKFDLDQLKESITKFGIVEPVIVNNFKGRENIIIGGHQRIVACKELGHLEVPCFIVELSEQDEKILNLALNKIQGRWDEAKLSDLIFNLRENGAQSITGFMNEEIEQYLIRKQLNNEVNGDYNPDDDEELKKLFDVHEKVPITVGEPESPRIKTRLSFYTETFEEYDLLRKFFETTRKGELNKDKLVEMVKQADGGKA